MIGAQPERTPPTQQAIERFTRIGINPDLFAPPLRRFEEALADLEGIKYVGLMYREDEDSNPFIGVVVQPTGRLNFSEDKNQRRLASQIRKAHGEFLLTVRHLDGGPSSFGTTLSYIAGHSDPDTFQKDVEGLYGILSVNERRRGLVLGYRDFTQ